LRARLGLKEQQGHKAKQDPKVKPALKDLLVFKARPGLLARLGPKVRPVLKVRPEQRAQQDSKAIPGLLVKPEPKVTQVQDCRVRLDSKDRRETLDLKERQVP